MTNPRILSGTARPALGDAVSEALGTEPVECEVERFPDCELQPVVGRVRGEDVYVVPPAWRSTPWRPPVPTGWSSSTRTPRPSKR